jgi:hypothetical protein
MERDRFVVFQVDDEWWLSHGDRTLFSFMTREEAARSAFDAASSMASRGHAVSVLILPDGPDAAPECCAVLSGPTPSLSS